MEDHKWRYKEDCSIVRPDHMHAHTADLAALVDCDGDCVFTVPNSWTDTQIFKALEIANRAYAVGYSTGERAKAHEIAKALYLNK